MRGIKISKKSGQKDVENEEGVKYQKYYYSIFHRKQRVLQPICSLPYPSTLNYTISSPLNQIHNHLLVIQEIIFSTHFSVAAVDHKKICQQLIQLNFGDRSTYLHGLKY